MQIGSPSYKKCPHCRQKNIYFAGPFFVNFYGLTEWSDGETFQELPNLKKTKLQKCDSCNQYFWFTQKLGGLCFEEYVEAAEYFEDQYSKKTLINLINSSRNKRRILYIRLHIHRRYNDLIRIHPLTKNDKVKESIPAEMKEIFTKNIKLLLDLVTDIKPNDHLLMAELYRNSGAFDKAKKALFHLKASQTKELLLSAIEQEHCAVIIIKQPLAKHLK